MGYDHVYGFDVEHNYYSPLYEDVLNDYIHRLNKNASEDAIQEALFKLKNFENGDITQQNIVFMDYLSLRHRKPFTIDKERSKIGSR